MAVDDVVAVGQGSWLAEVDRLGVPVQLDEPLTLAVADSEEESDRVTLGLELGDGDNEEERVQDVVGVALPEDDVLPVLVQLGLPIAEDVAVIDSVCVRLGVAVGVCEDVCVKLGVKLWDVVCDPTSSSPLK